VLSGRRSTWGVADVTAEVEASLARSGVAAEPAALATLAAQCREAATARCVSVLDPALHTPTSMSRHLSSDAVVAADVALNVGLAERGGGGARDTDAAWRARASGGLDAGQAQALGALCGTAGLEVVIGPAGAGKTRVLREAAERLGDQGRDMVIVAPTRKAALVAGAEAGTEASSLSKLLHEHGFRWDDVGRWSRLRPGQVDPATGRRYLGPRPPAVLSSRSVVVVDEAGLMTVDQANALLEVTRGPGAAVRLVVTPASWGPSGGAG